MRHPKSKTSNDSPSSSSILHTCVCELNLLHIEFQSLGSFSGFKMFQKFSLCTQRKKKVYYEKDHHINIRRMSTFPLAVYPLVGQWDPTTVCSLSWGNGRVEEVCGLSILSYQCTASTPGGILPFIVNMNSYWN